jgi:hypothetical protein
VTLVFNASPLIILAKVRLLDQLAALGNHVIVPQAVIEEVRRDAARTLGELLDRATQFDRTAGSSTDAEEWFRAESESLLHWAEETGRLLSSAELGELIAGFKKLNGGLEHHRWRCTHRQLDLEA